MPRIRMIFGTRVTEDEKTRELPAESIQDVSDELAKDLVKSGRAEAYFAPGEVQDPDPKAKNADPKATK